jgi:3',5'-cyclic AMP phosphodiesterase CpdA
VAERIRSEGAQLIVTTGDNAYDTGSETDLDLRVFPQIGELLGSVPIIASLGNHDVATDGGAPSRRAFGIPATGYHSFDAGPVHFLVLDSNDRCLARGCPQTEWLMADLADAARPFVFVFFHSTVSSCGRHGTDTTLREAWHPLFAAAGVDVVFMGHDHGYQRSVPTDGVLYVTTGGGGADLYTWSDDCPIAAVVADATTDGGAHHALIVDVEAERATIRAVRGSDGFVLDEVALAP